MTMQETLIDILPDTPPGLWQFVCKREEIIREIHAAKEKPILLDTNYGEFFLGKDGQFTDKLQQAYILSGTAFDALFEHICKDSVYAFEGQLKKGFMTLPGGYRMGVCGELVVQSDGSFLMQQYTSFTLRIAHDLILPVEGLLHRMQGKGFFKNTILISPPGAGKTTLLRNLIRSISDGTDGFHATRVGVVDERKEISGWLPQNQSFSLGLRTDVMLGVDKAKGISMLLRSMAPAVICVDELGGKDDFEAIREAARCGVGIIATMHGGSLLEAKKRTKFWGYNLEEFFQCYFFLQKEWREQEIGKQILFTVHEVTEC